MARAQVEQIRCDRCKREHFRPLVPVTGPQTEKKLPDFRVELHTMDAKGQPKKMTLEFQDLDSQCREAIENLFPKLVEWKRDGKPMIGEPDREKASPLAPPEAVTPVRPHSPGSIKK